MRVVEYTVHTTGPDGNEDSSEVFALVTDLLDIEAYPAHWTWPAPTRCAGTARR